MKLLKLYEDILQYCSMKSDEHDEICTVLDEDVKPAMIEGRRLVMPTSKQLKNYHPDKVIIFHPLQEYIDRGESEVVKKLRHHLNVKINFTTFTIATSLLKLVASPAEHRKLNPEQRDLLLSMPTVDMKTEANFVDFVVKRYAEMANRLFANIYLKKAGVYQGKNHARVGIVTFPYYELFDDQELKIRQADREAFQAIIEFIFPESKTEKEAYNAYSDSHDAPWLEALLKTSYKLTSRLNELLEMYKAFIPDAEDFMFNLNWIDPIDNLDEYRPEIRRIPSQRGNEGTVERKGEPERSTIPARPTPPPSIERASPQNVPVTPQQSPVSHYPQYPQQPYQQPGYPQYPQQPMQPMAPPTVQLTENGKLDFRSVEAVNPAVAAAGMISAPLTQWQMTQQMSQAGMMPPQGYNPAVAQMPGMRALAPTPNMGYPQQLMGYPQPPMMPGMMLGMYPQQPMQQPYQQGYDPRFQQPMIRPV